jgi:hypothetical protein
MYIWHIPDDNAASDGRTASLCCRRKRCPAQTLPDSRTTTTHSNRLQPHPPPCSCRLPAPRHVRHCRVPPEVCGCDASQSSRRWTPCSLCGSLCTRPSAYGAAARVCARMLNGAFAPAAAKGRSRTQRLGQSSGGHCDYSSLRLCFGYSPLPEPVLPSMVTTGNA